MHWVEESREVRHTFLYILEIEIEKYAKSLAQGRVEKQVSLRFEVLA